MRARTDFLYSFGDDLIAGLEAIGDDPVAANTVTDRNRADVYLVVGIHDGDLVIALQLRDRALRNQQRIFLRADDGANFPISAGTQNVCRIGKKARKADRAGAFVDLTVGKIKRAFVSISLAVRQNQLETKCLIGL